MTIFLCISTVIALSYAGGVDMKDSSPWFVLLYVLLTLGLASLALVSYLS